MALYGLQLPAACGQRSQSLSSSPDEQARLQDMRAFPCFCFIAQYIDGCFAGKIALVLIDLMTTQKAPHNSFLVHFSSLHLFDSASACEQLYASSDQALDHVDIICHVRCPPYQPDTLQCQRVVSMLMFYGDRPTKSAAVFGWSQEKLMLQRYS